MQYSQKYALVQFFEQTVEGQTFPMTDWPLHITLADVFAVDITTDLMNDLTAYVATFSYIVTHVAGDGTLGTTDVWLLENTPELQAFHEDLVDILEKHGAKFNTPEFTRHGFIPHITKQHGWDLKAGDTVSIDLLSLVDMFPDADWQQRRIVKRFTPEAT